MNIMSTAFEKAGVHPRDAEFNIAIAKYLNSGGDFAGAQALLDAAKLTSGNGQLICASSDAKIALLSPGSRLEGEEGPRAHAQQSLIGNASFPSSDRDGRGRDAFGLTAHKRSASSVREPSVGQRVASLNVAKIGVMDSLKIDGRPFRDWGLAEAERAGRSKTRDGYILSASAKRARLRYANLNGSEKLADLITVKQLQRIHQKAAELTDAA